MSWLSELLAAPFPAKRTTSTPLPVESFPMPDEMVAPVPDRCDELGGHFYDRDGVCLYCEAGRR